jgi:PTH1 family peptidyl-tRNA hydrolase
MAGIRLIAGLGNPGPKYRHTRHNVGADFVEWLASRAGIRLAQDSRFKGLVGRGQLLGTDVFLLIPETYVNLSGESVSVLQRFYKLELEQVLVAYDEVAFEPGVLKLKDGGGAGGHNGIRSIIQCSGNQQGFLRLRIGVGHPGDKERMVAYLTSERMPEGERTLVESTWTFDDQVWHHLFAGDLQKAMTLLHMPRVERTPELDRDK